MKTCRGIPDLLIYFLSVGVIFYELEGNLGVGSHTYTYEDFVQRSGVAVCKYMSVSGG